MIDPKARVPKVRIEMEAWRFRIMEMVHAGYGSPQKLMDERVDFVMDAYEYFVYRTTFEYQSHLLARDE